MSLTISTFGKLWQSIRSCLDDEDSTEIRNELPTWTLKAILRKAHDRHALILLPDVLSILLGTEPTPPYQTLHDKVFDQIRLTLPTDPAARVVWFKPWLNFSTELKTDVDYHFKNPEEFPEDTREVVKEIYRQLEVLHSFTRGLVQQD